VAEQGGDALLGLGESESLPAETIPSLEEFLPKDAKPEE